MFSFFEDVVIVNITNEKALTWTFDISSVDGLPIDDVNIKTDLLNNFINVTVTETHVMLMVVKPLNKEYFCRLYVSIMHNIIYRYYGHENAVYTPRTPNISA